MRTRYIERIVLVLLFFSAFSNSIARAADQVSRDVIGFSTDGRYFGFEQYGVLEGSGFPYAEIMVTDTETGKQADGFPRTKRIDDEKATVAQARQALREEAQTAITQYKLTESGEHLASNLRAEISANPYSVTVNMAHRAEPPKSEPLTFWLTEKPLHPEECAKYANASVKGFSLVAMKGWLIREAKEEHAKPNRPMITLHDDASLPPGRGCALGYSIADVTSHISNEKTVYAILLHVRVMGAEGPIGRFIATTHVCRQPDCGLTEKQ
jgi:predicted secreted protein